MKKFLSVLMVVAMLFAIAIPVAAEISPGPKPEHDVDAGVVPEDGGEVNEIINGDGTITLIVKPDDKHTFVKWEIEGEYEIISGSLTDTTITIKPVTDVKADAVLNKNTATDDKPTPKPPQGSTSPSTGVTPVLCAVAMVVSMAGAGYSFKKSSK